MAISAQCQVQTPQRTQRRGSLTQRRRGATADGVAAAPRCHLTTTATFDVVLQTETAHAGVNIHRHSVGTPQKNGRAKYKAVPKLLTATKCLRVAAALSGGEWASLQLAAGAPCMREIKSSA
jgi:hypothetical protein